MSTLKQQLISKPCAAYWLMRQIIGADPRVSVHRARDFMMQLLCVYQTEDSAKEEMSNAPLQRTIPMLALSQIIEKLRLAHSSKDEERKKWTIGRKGPHRLAEYATSVFEYVQAAPCEMMSIQDCDDKVKGIGPWSKFSILHHVVRAPVYVPGDSRVYRNALKSVSLVTMLGETPTQDQVDYLLCSRFGNLDKAKCKHVSKKRKRHRWCEECASLTPKLRVVYETLNKEQLSNEEAERMWKDLVDPCE